MTLSAFHRGFLGCLAGLAVLAWVAAVQGAPRVLKQEPAFGGLREGERVLVDDGSCGPGRILELTGGNHPKGGGTKNIVRGRRCIKK